MTGRGVYSRGRWRLAPPPRFFFTVGYRSIRTTRNYVVLSKHELNCKQRQEVLCEGFVYFNLSYFNFEEILVIKSMETKQKGEVEIYGTLGSNSVISNLQMLNSIQSINM